MSDIVNLAIVGAGSRGSIYAKYAMENPEKCKVVAVAEPRKEYRDQIIQEHGVDPDMVFESWEDIAASEKLADAVIISTQDHMHVEPSVAFANLKYHILLEKPMAQTELECRTIVNAAIENEIIFSVCHVLRYTPYTKRLKELLASGIIGDIVTMRHLEPVGYWHQAHSFVRGNWRKQSTSNFMLMAKSCHDLDWISHIMGSKCRSVSSFGSLAHFNRDNQPKGAADRCLDCKLQDACAYSAKKIYLDAFDAECKLPSGVHSGFLNVVTPEPTRESLIQALKSDEYGYCVYCCDNDVVDNQIVNLEFETGQTVSFTMTAFTEYSERKTSIHGTKGVIEGDTFNIKIYDYLTDTTKYIDVDIPETDMVLHGGGDHGIMESFITAIKDGNPDVIISGPEATLESHLMVFAAEKSRLNRSVEDMKW